MKKLWIGLLAFAMLFAGGVMLTNNISYAEDEAAKTEKSYTVENFAQLVEAFQEDIDCKSIELKYDIRGAEIKDADEKVTGYQPLEINVASYKGGSEIFFDGKGHTITNLSLYSSEPTGYLALLPQASGATIKNLKLEGTLSFDLNNFYSTGGYIGGLVGYGENVKIENCELNLSDITAVATDTFSIDRNINFGVLAGRIDGNGINYNVQDCVAYYDSIFSLDKMINASVGGLVGTLSQGLIVNSINYGNIDYSVNKELEPLDNVKQYVGGIVGDLSGTSAQVRNCLYGGLLIFDANDRSSYVGGIIGGCSSSFTAENVRYDYFVQADPFITPVGDGKILIRSNLQKLSNASEAHYNQVNQTVLQDTSIFDGSLKAWDFEKTWDYKNSKVILQRFEKFDFKINDNFEIALGEVKALEKAYFDVEGAEKTSHQFEYGDSVIVYVEAKGDCKGWFEKLSIYKNVETEVSADIKENITTGSWEFSLTADASTAGTYSFSVNQITYTCQVATSNIEHGGVKISDASATTQEITLSFNYSYSDKTREVVAEANGVYIFDHWELKIKDEYGNWKVVPSLDMNAATIKIAYKNGLISYDETDNILTVNQIFRLEAFYVADPAVVDFQMDENVQLVTLNGVEFKANEPVNVSKKAKSVPLKIVVKKGYDLDVSAFENEIIDLSTTDYTVDQYIIPANFQNDTVLDEEGNKVYSFNIDISAVKNYIENTSFMVKLKTIKEEGTNHSDLLWLWITLPVVGVLAIAGVLTFILIRRRRGGRGSKGGRSSNKTSTKPKSESYKDYFV